MSQRPINRSRDLNDLRDEGYDLEVRSGCLLVKDVPYVNSGKEIKRGILVVKLVLADDQTGKPDTHVAYFSGEYPCNEDGTPIEKIRAGSGAQSLAEGVIIEHTFSAKPKPDDAYSDYHAQVTTYVAILSGPAQRIDPSKTARTHPLVVPDADDDEPFNYIDTASSRAGIVAATRKLALDKIAIVGTGGTGSYVLDLVAKTPVKQVHLYDGDTFLQHNAFRSPGAPSGADLRAKQPKATYFRNLYAKMHRGIVDHPVYLDASNVEELRGMGFVFVCLDRNRPKKLIVEKLEEFNIPFTDVGMGIQMDGDSLGGILRVTDQALESIALLCEPVQPPKGELEHIHYFCGNTEIPDDLKAHETQRAALYKSAATLLRAYANIADDLLNAGYSDSASSQIKQDLNRYVKLREIIRQASGETIDLKAYEADMRHLIDTYIEAKEPRKISDFDDIGLLDVIGKSGMADAISSLPDGIKGNKSAVAETIANNVRSKIIKEHLNDPVFYDKMSALLKEILTDLKAKRIDFEEFLKRVAEQVIKPLQAGKSADTPAKLDTPGKRALYNILGGKEELALKIDEKVKAVRPADWRGKKPRENVIKNALLPLLGNNQAEVERVFLILFKQTEY